MAFTAEQIAALSAKLDRASVKTREQAGRKLSYIEAYHAENEANRIFGFDAWDRFTELALISECMVGDKHRVYYRAKVRIVVRTPGGGTVTREGCGYGSGIDKDLGQAHESALKESESDAEKRALKTFGNPFGQALYDKDQSDVETVAKPPPAPREPSAAVTAACAAIDMCKSHADLDEWAGNNGPAIREMPDDDARAVRAHFGAKQRSIREAA
jgi:DNA repair and recombination protein RAD52